MDRVLVPTLYFRKHIESEDFDILINYVSSDIYELFRESRKFEETINIQKRAFLQEKKCDILATRTQQA